MRNITVKKLEYSSRLIAQGRLDEEEQMVISSQLKQAAFKIQQLELIIVDYASQSQSKPEPIKTAEEILHDEVSDSIWEFICTYPVAYKSEIMLKDWIIQAMEEYRNQPDSQKTVTDEDIEEWAGKFDKYDPTCRTSFGAIEGAKAQRDGLIKGK